MTQPKQTERDKLIEELRKLLAKATPGPWDIYVQRIECPQDAKDELCDQVDAMVPFGDELFLLNANGKCPATTGCGPMSEANAYLIVAAVNGLPRLLDELQALRREALEEAAKVAEHKCVAHGLGNMALDIAAAIRALGETK